MTDDDASPWVCGQLRITPEALGFLEEELLRAYGADEEACGYLTGPADAPLLCDRVEPMANLANRLHALDPERYFRSARTFFAFNEKKFDSAVARGLAAGQPVKVLYHSHLDTGAYFSDTDRAVLSMGEPPAEEGGKVRLGPGPAWPLAFLVSSVAAAVVKEHRLYIWHAGDFEVSPLSVIA